MIDLLLRHHANHIIIFLVIIHDLALAPKFEIQPLNTLLDETNMDLDLPVVYAYAPSQIQLLSKIEFCPRKH